MRTFIVLATWLFVFSHAAFAAESLECGSDTLQGPAFRWCIQKPDQPNGDVLWYFHGAFQDERAWNDFRVNKAVRAEWKKLGVRAPTVISISFGSLWFLRDDNKFYPHFVEKIRPYLEKKAGEFSGRRMLMGFSMGGFNAAQVLARQGALFSRVLFINPAFVTVSPFAPDSEIEAYYRRHAPYLNRFKAGAYFDLLEMQFKSADQWLRYDPMLLVKNGLPRGLAIYVCAGTRDEFGFHEGAEAYAQLAKLGGGSVVWESLVGEHTAANPLAIAQFLTAPALAE